MTAIDGGLASGVACIRPAARWSSRARVLLLPAFFIAALTSGLLLPTPAAARPEVVQVVIDGSINPASADYIIQAIAFAEQEGAAAVLIELDTPGGLVSSSQDIIQAMLNAKVPIIVYVTPRGAWAASAGTFITMAANVAAMAPGSSIGAAHPVGVTGGGQKGDEEGEAARDISMEKAENLLAAYMESIAKQRNRNVEWAVDAVRNSVAITADEALELGVIDFVADDREELFDAIEGREVEVSGDPVVLSLEDAILRPFEMTVLQRIFNFLSDPNVAVILMFAGLAGLYIEFNNPGLIVPGVAGAICLVLTGFAFQILPFSWIGLLLVFVGLALIVAEVFITSFGLLFVAGIGCFLLGGSMVFEQPDLSDLSVSFWSVLVPVVVGLGGFTALVVFAVGRTFLLAQTSGVDEMIGLVGQSSTRIDPEGKIFVRGEYWNVAAEEPIEPGEPVEVIAVENLKLRVRRAMGTR
jgi:membrane-bound serine protease (ClpP class)